MSTDEVNWKMLFFPPEGGTSMRNEKYETTSKEQKRKRRSMWQEKSDEPSAWQKEDAKI